MILIFLFQCETQYEDQYETQCSPAYKTEYKTEYETKCEDKYETQCKTVYDTVYETQYDQQCTTVYKDQCSTAYETQVNKLSLLCVLFLEISYPFTKYPKVNFVSDTQYEMLGPIYVLSTAIHTYMQPLGNVTTH